MTYYKAHSGNWTEGKGVKRIGESFSRKEIFATAMAFARETGKEVTVSAERGSAYGLHTTYYTVRPNE